MMYIIFVSNMLMIKPHIDFNISFDLMYDICYPWHVKTHFFVFALVVVSPKILDLSRFLTY